MISFPNCKINLGLRVLQQRTDGFHNIETIFYPVPLTDVLEITPLADAAQAPAFFGYGLPIAGEPTTNLCLRAWQLVKKDFPDLPAVQVHLLKHIPMGAGLGGGSADGAFMLQLLNNKFRLNLTTLQLADYALQLGSDCPFFIYNKSALASGRGELLQPLPVALSGYQLVLVHPGIHVPTGWAFQQLNVNDSLTEQVSLQEIIARPIAGWRQVLTNDFEPAVFQQYPAIEALKEHLYVMGAVYAAMSGSGSTVYGLFNKSVNLTSGLPAHYTVIQL